MILSDSKKISIYNYYESIIEMNLFIYLIYLLKNDYWQRIIDKIVFK